jgi:hypothetical protein
LLRVPAGEPAAMPTDERNELAARTLIQVLDSEDALIRPTLGFRDWGIGLTPAQMPTTILSLEGSNKLHKRYLHGVFGKGGSVTGLFSKATVIVSRRHPDHLLPGEADSIAIAVVREGDSPDARLPFFRYLVRPSDRLPFHVPAGDVDFEPGTMVLHIGYEADRLGSQKWEYEESIYAYAETVLFRPTLPYRLEDARSGSNNRRPAGRESGTLMGLGQRLDKNTAKDGLKDKSGISTVPVPSVGDVQLRWWLYDHKDRIRKRAAKGFSGLFITGGQVHHTWDAARLKMLVEGRQRVAPRIIVEVNCETLDQQDKVRIFSSFRDSFLRSTQAVALERAVADWLARDPDLGDAETQLTLEALSASGVGVSADLRDRINRAVRSKMPGLLGAGAGAGAGSTPPKAKPVEELYEEPTTFVGPERIEVLPGHRKTFYMQCNARDGFIPERGDIQLIAGVGSPPLQFGRGDLRRGRLQVSLCVAAEAPLGTSQLELGLVWESDGAGRRELRWPVEVSVAAEPKVPTPPNTGKPKKQGPRGDIAFLWADHKTQPDWNDAIVGELQPIKGRVLAELAPETYKDLKRVDAEIPTIVLNRDFKELATYLKSVVGDIGDQALNARRDRYAIAVGVTVANLSVQERKLQKRYNAWEEGGRQGTEPERPMTEEQTRRALRESARGVMALLPDFDKLLSGRTEADKALV